MKPKKTNKRHKSVLTPLQLAFVANFKGNAEQAALAAGYKQANKNSWRLMLHPLVKAALAKKEQAFLKKSGEQDAKAAVITRTEVMEIAAKVARSLESDDRAKIAAATLLAKILGMIVNKSEDVTKKFAGWTEEEMEQYAVTGVYPERIRSLLGSSGVPGSAGDSPAGEAIHG